jgi:hypothetical protein
LLIVVFLCGFESLNHHPMTEALEVIDVVIARRKVEAISRLEEIALMRPQ